MNDTHFCDILSVRIFVRNIVYVCVSAVFTQVASLCACLLTVQTNKLLVTQRGKWIMRFAFANLLNPSIYLRWLTLTLSHFIPSFVTLNFIYYLLLSLFVSLSPSLSLFVSLCLSFFLSFFLSLFPEIYTKTNLNPCVATFIW